MGHIERAAMLGEFREAIRADGLEVEVQPGMAWVFIRQPGFQQNQFGNAHVREKRLGKWIAEFPWERVPTEAMKLLPLVGAGTIRTAKFSNPSRKAQPTGVVVSYCLDKDSGVAAALRELGWEIRWKFNHQTFEEMG